MTVAEDSAGVSPAGPPGLDVPAARGALRQLASSLGGHLDLGQEELLGESLTGWDADLHANHLQPGGLPIELSFSEGEPDAMRVTIEPYGLGMGPDERCQRASEVMTRAARDCFGEAAEMTSLAPGRAVFGAFLGGSWGSEGVRSLKLYLEAPGGPSTGTAPPLAGTALRPELLMISTTWTRDGQVGRAYGVFREGLALVDLVPAMEALGLGHRAPDLLASVLALTGGRWVLPPRSALVGLRGEGGAAELKLELIPGALAPATVLPGVRAQLAERPDAARAFERWWSSIHRVFTGVEARVVSLRVTPESGSRLNVYARVGGVALAKEGP